MFVLVLPDIPDEDRLLAQARRGSRDAILRIYELYFPPIYQFIRMRVDDIQQAEDIASEVFLQLVKVLPGQQAPRHSLRGWLFKVARSQLARHYRRQQRIRTAVLDEWIPDVPENEPEVQFIRSLDREQARRAIRMLADDQQEVILLRFGQGLSLRETADVMGRSVSAVKSLQFRAVDTLRQILGQRRGEQRP